MRETLTQVSLELEASVQAAKQAVLCASDEKAFSANVQQMHARLNQANYFARCFQAIFEGNSIGREVGDEADMS